MTIRGLLCLTSVLVLAPSAARADKLVRIAGGGTEEANLPAVRAKLNQPFGIDFDKDGNFYLVELQGQRVLKVDGKGILTVVAGTGAKGNSGDGGPAKDATFNGADVRVSINGGPPATHRWNGPGSLTCGSVRVRLTNMGSSNPQAELLGAGPACTNRRKH